MSYTRHGGDVGLTSYWNISCTPFDNAYKLLSLADVFSAHQGPILLHRQENPNRGHLAYTGHVHVLVDAGAGASAHRVGLRV